MAQAIGDQQATDEGGEASNLYFEGLYDGIFMFSDVEEAELVEDDELEAAVLERYEQARTGGWDFPVEEFS